MVKLFFQVYFRLQMTLWNHQSISAAINMAVPQLSETVSTDNGSQSGNVEQLSPTRTYQVPTSFIRSTLLFIYVLWKFCIYPFKVLVASLFLVKDCIVTLPLYIKCITALWISLTIAHLVGNMCLLAPLWNNLSGKSLW